jgi:hypothetical protein
MGTLTVHVMDEDENPVAGITVFCKFRTTHSEKETDDDGVAVFENVPACMVKVYVEGEFKGEVDVAENDDKDVTILI